MVGLGFFLWFYSRWIPHLFPKNRTFSRINWNPEFWKCSKFSVFFFKLSTPFAWAEFLLANGLENLKKKQETKNLEVMRTSPKFGISIYSGKSTIFWKMVRYSRKTLLDDSKNLISYYLNHFFCRILMLKKLCVSKNIIQSTFEENE